MKLSRRIKFFAFITVAVLLLGFLSTGSVLAGHQNSDPIPSNLIVEKHGLEWVWASPCISGGCTGTILLRDGFRFATAEEFAIHPNFREMGGTGIGNAAATSKCASPYFDPIHHHCDALQFASGFVASDPALTNASDWETLLVRGQAFATDTTPPTITPVVTGTLGNNSWYTSNVGVVWSVTDPDSGVTIDSGCVDTNFTADTAGTSLSCTATSDGGTTGPVSVNIKIDKTSPAVTATVSAPGGSNGWHVSNVTVTGSGTDATSGIATCTDNTLTGDNADQESTVSCTDNAGNTGFATATGIDIDQTDPAVTANVPSPDGSNGWHVSNVKVTGSGTDATSGIATCTDNTLTGDNADQESTVSCTDNAGNTDSATATGIDIDQTDPAVTAPDDQVVIGTSAAGAAVSFSASADASVSGLDTLDSSPASGSTFPVGTTTVTHTAVDLAGNDSSATHTVTVLGAQGMKNRAIADLTPFEDESKKIEKAIKEINKSLEKGFVDETHLDSKDGKKVFDHEKHAVKELLHVLKEATKGKGKNKVSEDAAAAVRRAIDDLVTADRLLATVQIEAAQAATALDQKNQDKLEKEIEKALKELDKGDKELAKGKEDKAIDDYKKAWEHATHALKEAKKAPKGKK